MPGFNRHRQREETPKEVLVKKEEPVKEVKKTTPIVKVEKPKEEVKQEVKTLPVISKNDIEEDPSLSQDRPQEIDKTVPRKSQDLTEKPVIVSEVKKEEIDKLPVKEKKKRVDTKEANLVGIVGKTIEARDFRAICKKAGWQINDKLTEMLRAFNMAHYNL